MKLQAKRQRASAASWCLGSSSFGCNLAVGSILDFGHSKCVYCHIREQCLRTINCFGFAKAMLGPSPLCLVLVIVEKQAIGLTYGVFCICFVCTWLCATCLCVVHFYLEVLKGPIWSFLCIAVFPLFSISFMFSPVTCRIAHTFTEEVGRSCVFSQNSHPNICNFHVDWLSVKTQCWNLLFLMGHLRIIE